MTLEAQVVREEPWGDCELQSGVSHGTSVNPIIRTSRYALYVNFVIWKGCILYSCALEIFKFQYNNTSALEMLW